MRNNNTSTSTNHFLQVKVPYFSLRWGVIHSLQNEMIFIETLLVHSFIFYNIWTWGKMFKSLYIDTCQYLMKIIFNIFTSRPAVMPRCRSLASILSADCCLLAVHRLASAPLRFFVKHGQQPFHYNKQQRLHSNHQPVAQ